jgi:cation diffusion facilitator CzcD-associated flavoprotein CzcO
MFADDTPEERELFFEQMWGSQGFIKLIGSYADLTSNRAATKAWCEFIERKIRSIVQDPVVADKLVPKDHLYGEKRPPFGKGYYETFNRPNVSLVDLNETPIVRVTERGIETTAGSDEFDIIVWATGFDFASALNRMGIRGRDGRVLADEWQGGPSTFLGLAAHGYPNLLFPGGPHGAGANVPRYNTDQVDFVMDLIEHMRRNGYSIVEATRDAVDSWTTMVDSYASTSMFTPDKSYFFGSNVPGKARRLLLNPLGRISLFATIDAVRTSGYREFSFDETGGTPPAGDTAAESSAAAAPA